MAEIQHAHETETGYQGGDFERFRQTKETVFVPQQEHQKRGDKKYAEHIANPPNEPECGEICQPREATQAEKGDSPGGGQRWGEQRAKEDETQSIRRFEEGALAVGISIDEIKSPRAPSKYCQAQGAMQTKMTR